MLLLTLWYTSCYGIPEDRRMLTNSHATTLVFVTCMKILLCKLVF